MGEEIVVAVDILFNSLRIRRYQAPQNPTHIPRFGLFSIITTLGPRAFSEQRRALGSDNDVQKMREGK